MTQVTDYYCMCHRFNIKQHACAHTVYSGVSYDPHNKQQLLIAPCDTEQLLFVIKESVFCEVGTFTDHVACLTTGPYLFRSEFSTPCDLVIPSSTSSIL
jgi:hypothetical protein